MTAAGERVAVTGANGFVGRASCRALLAEGAAVTGIVRTRGTCEPHVDEYQADTLEAITPAMLEGCRAVVHLAARVHVMRDAVSDPLAAFRAVNVEGTLSVARAAQQAGAQRFVFVSSIKALAEADAGRPLKETDERRPQDAYGISKAEAEVQLAEFGARTGLEIVVVRPPLVYGPHVRANFLSLLGALSKGMPLPVGAVQARRSLCFVDNLASALVACALHPRAAGQLFHVTDGDDPTVADLARTLGRHLGKPARLVNVPVGMLRLAGKLTGKRAQIERLTGSLQVDSNAIRTVLGWQPPATLDAGLAATAAWYRGTHPQ
jgi:UDP-glucose 4-epimerase